MTDTRDDVAVPCPYCGHHTLYRPEGWVEGGPVACANPLCDSNHPPTTETCCCGRKLRHPEPSEEDLGRYLEQAARELIGLAQDRGRMMRDSNIRQQTLRDVADWIEDPSRMPGATPSEVPLDSATCEHLAALMRDMADPLKNDSHYQEKT